MKQREYLIQTTCLSISLCGINNVFGSGGRICESFYKKAREPD